MTSGGYSRKPSASWHRREGASNRMKASRHTRRAAERLFRDCRVGTRVDEDLAKGIAIGVIQSHRRHGVAVLSEFARLLRLDRDRHRAIVESAEPLPADLQAVIEGDLAQRGFDQRPIFIHAPALIGGMRVTIGSDVYDGSVRGRLVALARQLDEES
jgi:F-type H+-transporting ATPase subunit delta